MTIRDRIMGMGAVLAALIVLGSPPLRAAAADDEKAAAQAKEHFKNGVALFEKGEFAGAMEEFNRSFFLKPIWMLRYNIGLCYLKLGYKAEGATELTLYLEKGGKSVKAAAEQEVKKILDELLPDLSILKI